MTSIKQSLMRLRPAWLAALIASTFRLNRRRMIRVDRGVFFIDPLSNFGYSLLQGDYEPSMTNVLDRYLSPGGTFIDMGANEGYFTVLGSKLVGPKGTVVSIEPQSRLQGVIQANLSSNECFNVRVIKCVVNGRSGPTKLSLAPSVNTGSSSLFPQTRYSLPSEQVPGYSLPELLDRIGVGSCDLLKVDIEGAEYDVFMEGTAVLKKGVFKNIALEFHGRVLDRRGLSAEALHRHMIACGYELNSDLGPRVYTFITTRGSLDASGHL